MLQVTTLLALLVAQLFLAVPVLTISVPPCRSSWDWASNSLGQNPCEVGALIQASCSFGNFTVEPLASPAGGYPGPEPGKATYCLCNSVSYSLFSACAACQGGTPSTYQLWSLNCPINAPMSTLGVNIPDGTAIPQWAFLNVSNTTPWTDATAVIVGDGVEVGPTPSPEPTSNPSGSQASHTGAAVGGVVGGLVGLGILIGAIAFFIIRRRRVQRDPSTVSPSVEFLGSTGSTPLEKAQSTVLETPPQRFYNPSDPTTFPSALNDAMLPTSTSGYVETAFEDLRPSHAYRGLPEI